MTYDQEQALGHLCARYQVHFDPANYRPAYDLPDGYVAGWVGPIYVGCDPNGRISS